MIIQSNLKLPISTLFSPPNKTHFLMFKLRPVNQKNTRKNCKNNKGHIKLCHKKQADEKSDDHYYSSGLCKCGRRHFMKNTIISPILLLPILPSFASLPPNSNSNNQELVNQFHPPKPDWYEELFASVLNNSMQTYEAEIAAYKSQLFTEVKGQAKEVLEIGIGTGPNLKYYVNGDDDMHVYGVDPNTKMEKYARVAASAAGLSHSNFEFLHAVGEVLPLSDASVDAVIGTLVMCSVKDVHRTLQEIRRVLKPGGMYLFIEHVAAKEGTYLRVVQNILDPLQQVLSDGCHLTRETGNTITGAGFSSVNTNMLVISSFSYINPHVYGIAHK